MGAHRGCEDGVAAQLDQLLTRRLDYLRGDGAEWFEAAQNAQIVREAERYYRAIYQGAAASWNLRDRHMFNTLGAVMAHRGAGAALVAATSAGPPITAVVSRGGRPDLAGNALPRVSAPTLLLVGSLDGVVIDLNRQALATLNAPKQLVIIEGTSHLFEEPGTLDQVITHAIRWFSTWFARVEARNTGHA